MNLQIQDEGETWYGTNQAKYAPPWISTAACIQPIHEGKRNFNREKFLESKIELMTHEIEKLKSEKIQLATRNMLYQDLLEKQIQTTMSQNSEIQQLNQDMSNLVLQVHEQKELATKTEHNLSKKLVDARNNFKIDYMLARMQVLEKDTALMNVRQRNEKLNHEIYRLRGMLNKSKYSLRTDENTRLSDMLHANQVNSNEGSKSFQKEVKQLHTKCKKMQDVPQNIR